MFKIDEKRNIHINRGDEMLIKLKNKTATFSADDKIVFSIMKKGNATEVVFSKVFNISEETNEFEILLTSEETRLGNPIKTGTVTYWYEIEYNGINTLIGYDTEGAKEFILYPEAIYAEEGSL